jgi:RHS repeat-associated protein
MIQRYAIAIAFIVFTAIGLTNGAPVTARQRTETNQTSTPTMAAGATATRLADGRWLLLGGEGSGGEASAIAGLWDPSSRSTVVLPTSMLQSRAGHSATLLPDGRVLIIGGRGRAGDLVSMAERFNPATETFEAVLIAGVTPRTGHTATLLTDGRVLVVGGDTGADRTAPLAELWNFEAATVTAVERLRPRAAHTATLLADGRVLIAGGRAGAGAANSGEDVFDPQTDTGRPLAGALADEAGVPAVTEVRPSNGATDVPVELMLTVRLSHALLSETVNDRTVVLSGPRGTVPARVVPAEGGRLVFVQPFDALDHDTAYALTMVGVVDAAGVPLAALPLRFTTSRSASTTPEVDVESWLPDSSGAANAWRTNRPPSSWQTLPALHAEPGVTALAGQVLTLDGRPLPDVALAIDGDRTASDRSGRFLLRLPTAGPGRHELRIDGRTANQPNRTYGFFEYGLTLEAGITTVLRFTIWMPRLDLAHQVTIASPTAAETVITTPHIRGLELHLPPQTVIRDEDGRVARQISITPIPVDRPPFPLPANVEVPIYFTIQPGGAYIEVSGRSGPRVARLVYPNYYRVGAGVIANFWRYDPGALGWYVYGAGKVGADGRQVVPDPGVGLYELTGAMFNTAYTPPATAAPPGDCRQDGDPVDLATGLLLVENTDLSLPDVLPLSLTRTYRPGDPAVRPFGIGTNHSYGLFLWSAQPYQQVDLVLPDGGRVHFVRTSPGTGFTDAVFEHTTSPSAFYKSVIRYNGNGWNLTLKDGTVYVFGDNAPLQAMRDRYGNQITVAHSNGVSGNVTRVTSPNGRWMAFSYDGSDRIVQAQDNAGRTMTYTYDVAGRLWKVTDPNGGVTTYTYDTSHRMLTITNPRNLTVVTNQYDANGRVSQQTHADTGVYRFAYTLDGTGRVAQTDVVDPRNTSRRTIFDNSGYCTSDMLARGLPEAQTTTWVRDSTSHLVLSATDALNRRTSFSYDTNGNRLTTTRLSGTAEALTTSFSYEPSFNQITSITDPLGHETSLAYDSNGNVTQYADGLHHVSAFAYRADGQPTSASDPLGHTTTYGYSGGDLTRITDPLGRTTTKFVDVIGRVVARTDPRGSRYQFQFDGLNRIVGLTDPIGGHTMPSYDANGNLVAVTDSRFSVTTYTHTNTDRPDSRTDPLMRTDHSEYDLNGNLVRFTDRKGQSSEFRYDGLNRRTFAGFGASGKSYQTTVSYTYDMGNRLTQVVDSAAGTITLEYDPLDRLVRETTPQGGVAYTYDADGRRASMTVVGQPTVTYSYDAAERLTTIAQGSVTVNLSYDEANRRRSLVLPNGIVGTYGYDAANQLTSLSYALSGTVLGDLTYVYDAAGNRTSIGGSWARVNLPPALASAAYDAANQLTQWGGQLLAYDANGNLASDGNKSYSWNTRNQLVTITGGTGASFQYDGLSRRTSKTVNGVATSFLYDNVNVVQELSGGTPFANILNGIGVDQRFLRGDTSGLLSYLTDGLPSEIALANGAGAVTTEYTFEPFGVGTRTGTSSTNAFEFAGRENDGTGLLYLRARYYLPAAGRFVSEDPVPEISRLRNALITKDDLNAYVYVRDNPIRWTDPDGRSPASAVRPPWPQPNGNLWPGTDPGVQDQRCTLGWPLGPLADSRPCFRRCCQGHDQCYADNQCNFSSWLVWLPVGPCNWCNVRTMNCILWSNPSRRPNPCGCPDF